jgi:hypothetical protein
MHRHHSRSMGLARQRPTFDVSARQSLAIALDRLDNKRGTTPAYVRACVEGSNAFAGVMDRVVGL